MAKRKPKFEVIVGTGPRLPVLAADPGAGSGIALVAPSYGHEKPILIGAYPIYGSNRKLWYARAKAAYTELYEKFMVDDRMEIDVLMEDPPPVSRRGSLAGDSHGQKTWLGLGRYQGMLIAACMESGWHYPELVQVREWTHRFGGRIPKKKDKTDGGMHRVAEAANFVVGAGEILATIPKTHKVNVAEAILIAAAFVEMPRA